MEKTKQLETAVCCNLCSRYGTRGFVPSPNGKGMVCRSVPACYERWAADQAPGVRFDAYAMARSGGRDA